MCSEANKLIDWLNLSNLFMQVWYVVVVFEMLISFPKCPLVPRQWRTMAWQCSRAEASLTQGQHVPTPLPANVLLCAQPEFSLQPILGSCLVPNCSNEKPHGGLWLDLWWGHRVPVNSLHIYIHHCSCYLDCYCHFVFIHIYVFHRSKLCCFYTKWSNAGLMLDVT